MEANFYSRSCGGEVCSCSTPILCSCSTTSSLTCSRPTSSSSMSRRPILPRFTASARIAKVPIATAPAALAPTPKAPRAVHACPVATRANATCAPNGGCSFRLALCIFFTVLSFPTRSEKTLVHLQNRFQVMSYSSDHETSHLCPYTFEKGAQGSAGRAALQRRLRPASLPDTPGERPWRDRAADSRKSWVRFADAARRYPRLQPARGGCPGCGLLTPKANSHRFRQRANRSSQRALTPLSQGVR